MTIAVPMVSRTLDSYRYRSRDEVETVEGPAMLKIFLCEEGEHKDIYVFFSSGARRKASEIYTLYAETARDKGYRLYVLSVETNYGSRKLREIEYMVDSNSVDPPCIELTEDLLAATLIG